jgi:uncharacterized protein YcbX
MEDTRITADDVRRHINAWRDGTEDEPLDAGEFDDWLADFADDDVELTPAERSFARRIFDEMAA